VGFSLFCYFSLGSSLLYSKNPIENLTSEDEEIFMNVICSYHCVGSMDYISFLDP
jgi:hypothetical protein